MRGGLVERELDSRLKWVLRNLGRRGILERKAELVTLKLTLSVLLEIEVRNYQGPRCLAKACTLPFQPQACVVTK